MAEEYFGYFPSFHDDKVIKFCVQSEGPTIWFQILTKTVTKEGKKVRKAGIVTFRLNGVSELELDGISDRNYLLQAEFASEENNRITVHLIGSTEFGARIVAETVEVESVTPV